MSGYSNRITTGLYDRRNDDISVGESSESDEISIEEVYRIGIGQDGLKGNYSAQIQQERWVDLVWA